jgi:hypothetical protein
MRSCDQTVKCPHCEAHSSKCEALHESLHTAHLLDAGLRRRRICDARGACGAGGRRDLVAAIVRAVIICGSSTPQGCQAHRNMHSASQTWCAAAAGRQNRLSHAHASHPSALMRHVIYDTRTRTWGGRLGVIVLNCRHAAHCSVQQLSSRTCPAPARLVRCKMRAQPCCSRCPTCGGGGGRADLIVLNTVLDNGR